MSNLALNNYTPLFGDTKREWGERTFPIWLLVNPKHPMVRHNIWTPILSKVQDNVYRRLHKRFDTKNLYIRNVISDGIMVPNTLNWWGPEVGAEIKLFSELLLEHKPKILISFGAFPFEFVRRASDIRPEKGPKYWRNSFLENEFKNAIENFDINKTNKFPLLHQAVGSGKFIEDQDSINENYFNYIGTMIARKLIENQDNLNIWID